MLTVLFLGTSPVAITSPPPRYPPLHCVALRFTLAGLLLLGLVCNHGVGGIS